LSDLDGRFRLSYAALELPRAHTLELRHEDVVLNRRLFGSVCRTAEFTQL
jgi:hypothetical protein